MQETPPTPFSTRARVLRTRLLRGLWLVLATLLMLAGLLVVLLHVFILPRIDSFRPDLEHLASTAVGEPVHIGRLRVIQPGWRPTIAMDDVALLDSSGQPALQVQRIEADLSLAAALRMGFDRVEVFRPVLQAQRLANGQLEVAGIRLTQGKQGDSGPALNWLLSQPVLSIVNGSVHWSDATRAQPPLLLSSISAQLENKGTRHRLKLNATPPQGWGQPVLFISEWSHPFLGDRTLWKNWSGAAYADLPELDMSQLRRYMELGRNVDLRKGHGRLRVWADFHQMRSSTATVDARLDEVDITLDAGLPPLALKNLETMFSVKFAAPDDAHASFRFATQKLGFTTYSNRKWPGGNVQVELHNSSHSPESRGALTGDHWDLGLIGELARSLPLGETMLEALESYRPGGLLDKLDLRWGGPLDKPDSFAAKGSASKITWLSQQGPFNRKHDRFDPGTPGVEGAAVDFDLNEKGGHMDIALRHGAVTLPGIFEEPRLPLRRFDARVHWKIDGDTIRAELPDVRFATDDASGHLKLEWHTRPLQKGDEPTSRFPGILRLDGVLERARAERVYRYLPLSLGTHAREYVQYSVLGGNIRNARVRIQGDLDHIPSKHRITDLNGKVENSMFRFEVPLTNAYYKFLPERLQKPDELPWPALTRLDGLLVIDGNRLEITNAQARFSTAPDQVIHELAAVVPDLADHNLTVGVSARTTGPLAQALYLANHSPLAKIANHALERATATGQTDLTLTLGLPINNMDYAKVNGEVVLKSNDIRITPETPLLGGSTGSVVFDERGFALREVRTHMLGGSAALEGGLTPSGKPSVPNPVVFQAQGDFSAAGLRAEPTVSFVAPLASYLEGRSQYQAKLQFDRGAPELTFDSDLNGMAVNLPAPLQKPAAGTLPLHFENTIVRNYQDPASHKLLPAEDQLLVRIGNLVSVHYVRDVRGNKPRVLRGSLAAGARAHESLPPLPEHDVHALVLLDEVDADSWQKVMERVFVTPAAPHNTSARQDSKEGDLSYLPSMVAVQTGALRLFNRKLDNLVAGGTRDGRLWRFTLESRQTNGYLEYLQPAGAGAGGVKARLERLIIEPVVVEDVKEIVRKTEDPETLPTLDIEANHVDVLGYKFDRVTLLAGNNRSKLIAGAPLSDIDADSSNAWRIQELVAHVPHGRLQGSGIWGQPRNATLPDGTPAQRFVALNVRLETDDLGAVLNHLELKDLVNGGGGVLAGTLRWRGSPISADLATLSGRVRMDVRNGGITKIDPGAVRLINLFSLQALSRLGASGSKGFGFDRASGTLRIRNGVVYTDDTELIGTTMADVKLNGSTSLQTRKVEATVLVQPKIDFGNAALAAAVVNPVVGVGGYLAQLVLSESINSAATQVLRLDGSWAEPKVQSLRGEEAQHAARQILVSHGTPQPPDLLWDWWPVQGNQEGLRWDWWPITAPRRNVADDLPLPQPDREAVGAP